MLSKYIKEKKAHTDTQAGFISLSFLSEPLTLDPLPSPLTTVTCLTLNHCGLTHLQGIQQFHHLQQLNVKYNDIRQVMQLYKISNKQNIVKMDFTGNDVEYMGGALFINLRKDYPNLIELNGKNYFHLLVNNKNKEYSMKKILKKANHLQKQMSKAVRSTDRNSKFSRKENYVSGGSEFEQTSTKSKTFKQQQQNHQLERNIIDENQNYQLSKHKKLNQDDDEDDEGYSSEDEAESTAKKYARNDIDEDYNYSEVGLRENINFNNLIYNQRDVSLGGISNIPMTKSVRGPNLSHCPPQRKKGLQIQTINQGISNQQNMQPTATFAMQRERQMNNSNFMFKNRSEQRYKDGGMPIEEYQTNSVDSQIRYTKRHPSDTLTYYPEDQLLLDEDSGLLETNIVDPSVVNNYRSQCLMAILLRKRVLQSNALQGLKRLLKNKNLPMQRSFLQW